MIQPAVPGRFFQTYSLVRPLGNREFWQTITCEQADCEFWRNGWRTVLNTTVVADVRTARWIIDQSGRRYGREQSGVMLTFTFPAGQRCFEKHQRAVEREPLYVVRHGRAAAPGAVMRRHSRGEDWRDDMADVLDKVNTQRARG